MAFQFRQGSPDPVRTAEVASAAVALAALTPSEAWAKGGQWGPLEGKASSHSAAVEKSQSMIGFQRFLEVWGIFLRFAVHQGPRIWTNQEMIGDQKKHLEAWFIPPPCPCFSSPCCTRASWAGSGVKPAPLALTSATSESSCPRWLTILSVRGFNPWGSLFLIKTI